MKDSGVFLHEFIPCDCQSREHLIELVLDKEYKELSLSIHLAPWGSFFTRIGRAIRYIFNCYKPTHGCWDSFIFNSEGIEELKKFIDEYENLKK